MTVQLTIDGTSVTAETGWTLLRAAQEAGVHVPSVCAHPDLPPQQDVSPVDAIFHGTRRIEHDARAEGLDGCGICVVELAGKGKVPACATLAKGGMKVTTHTDELVTLRRERMAALLERCRSPVGDCELQDVAELVGMDSAAPGSSPASGLRFVDEPLFERDLDLCVACGRCVRACDQREVNALGWVRQSDGRRWVGPLAPTPVEAGCRLCGSCVEVCPTGALKDKAIQSAQREDALVPCRTACPARIDVPRFVRLIAAGRLEEAACVVAERAPLVEVLGNVCHHPCEPACRRNDVNRAAISICRVEREAGRASATKWTEKLPEPLPDTGRKVAVVGGGPAGVTVAHLLHLLGHRVTVYEARRALGGMLRYGIPPFRLPRVVVDREIGALAQRFEVQTGTPVGEPGLSVAELRQKHDAVVVATGAVKSQLLGVDGEDLPEVRTGLTFLDDAASGRLEQGCFAGKKVAVVGGGNVATDCARSALRLGADRVELVCLEPPEEMPAYDHEIEQARQEGVRFLNGWGVRALEGSDSLRRLTLKRCTRVFDEQGLFAPMYDEDSMHELPADVAILAVGQLPDRSILPDSTDGVYLTGDLASGPKSVVDAIASAREVALQVDRDLGGPGELDLTLGPTDSPVALGRVEGFAVLSRLEPRALMDATLGLRAVNPGMQPDRAQREADRCLRCDLRLGYRAPKRPR